MGIISEASSLATILKELQDLRAGKKKKKELLETMLRQYYSEAYYNKRILETINIDNSMNKDKLSAIKYVAPLLKNDYGKAIVASLGLFENSLKLIESKKESETEDTLDEERGGNLISKIVFTVNRIDVLKNLCDVSDEKYLKDIMVSVRLRNIQNYTNDICSSFRESLDEMIKAIRG